MLTILFGVRWFTLRNAKASFWFSQNEPDPGRLKFTESKRLAQRWLPLLLSTVCSITHCARVGLTSPGKCNVAILLRDQHVQAPSFLVTFIWGQNNGSSCYIDHMLEWNFWAWERSLLCCNLTLLFKDYDNPELYLKMQFVRRIKHTPSRLLCWYREIISVLHP
jgi:hypothetical protein